jgi:hypothetical protein
MDQNQLALLREQYQDYFIIDHQTYVNVKPFLAAAPDDAAFEQLIPEPFLMAGEMAQLERSMLKPLARLGDMAEELAFYLKAQAKKIDTMMRYILLQQDDATYRYQTLSYGGSALNYLSQTALEPGQLLEVKLFLDQSEGAVFALAAVIACEPQQEKFLIRATFFRIREQDREVIVRASLHQQSKQLKLKAQLRQQEGKTF